MKKLIFSAALVAAILAGCGGEEDAAPAPVEETPVEESTPAPTETKGWNETLTEIINSADAPADKFYALESYMMDAQVDAAEVDVFKEDILKAYKDKTYLTDPTNDEVMLNFIFKSYIVEQNADGAWKDFAFDFFQNAKYVYRGVDAPDSDAVKANEAQIDKVIGELK